MTNPPVHDPGDDSPRDVARLEARVARLPRELPPPAEAWAVIEARRPGVTRVRGGLPPWITAPRLAVAAVGLVALSSLATLRWMSGERSSSVAQRSDALSSPPATLVRLDGSYAATIAHLEDALVVQRDRLSPETIAIVERSLATVDRALADARDALAADPANAMLRDLVVVSYETKIRLLRQVTEARHAS